jgi:hypothetical protein
MMDLHTHRWLSSDESLSLSAYKMMGPHRRPDLSLASNIGSGRLFKTIGADA